MVPVITVSAGRASIRQLAKLWGGTLAGQPGRRLGHHVGDHGRPSPGCTHRRSTSATHFADRAAVPRDVLRWRCSPAR